jgi:aryl-phospho-beta-D-glucosidase BglC (GH1 family)
LKFHFIIPEMNKVDLKSRRAFMKTAGSAVIGLGFGMNPALSVSQTVKKNKLPRWRGFNLTDFFSPDPGRVNGSALSTEDDLRWMSDWGFDFIRLPMAYPYYLKFDRSRDITPSGVYQTDESRLEEIDKLIFLAHKYHFHVSLCLHRAPGYCVNAGFREPFNLWVDQEALDAFCFHWEMWAKRYRNISTDKISFDLVNEPGFRADMNDQFSKRSSVPGEIYRKVAGAAADAIRKVTPERLIVADGNDTGSTVIPEIADLGIGQSCRSYYPGIISHYKAAWAFKDPESLPDPKWPGQVGKEYLSRKMLEDFYKPWIEIMGQGTGVHCGECGCWNKTPHQVFLAWFEDVLDILTRNQIGYALWNLRGGFGVLDSGRTDIAYEDWYGHKLDRGMLELLKKY